MDRTAFAACAAVFSLVLVVGCDAQPGAPPAECAPLVLAELQAASPGPWRSHEPAPISTTSLERLDHSRYVPPAPLEAPHAPGGEMPWAGQLSPFPLDDGAADNDPPLVPGEAEAADPVLRFAEPDHVGPDEAPGAAEPRWRNAPIEPADAPPPQPAADEGAEHGNGAPRTLDDIAAQRTPPVSQPAAERVALPWANAPARSAEMAAVLRRADQHVRHGITLTERNAMFLARAEFLAALQLIAQANDVQQNVQFYSDALAGGLAALDESGDFVRQRRVGKKLDLARIVSGHKTPILKQAQLDQTSPTVAAQRYYTYAQEQLAAAAAREPSGARALFGLGKLSIALAQGGPAGRLQSTGEAMVFYQAALLADSNNGRAAHELGVILAQNGDLLRARDLLVHSVRLSPHPSGHHNLAAVYAKLGQPSLAQQAKDLAIAMEAAGHRRAGPAVQWLDPATFAATAPASDSLLPPVSQPAAAPAPETTAPGESVSTARKGISDWLPWNTRR
jgi:tetratricopeptide (TPR) repeat protein